MIVISASRRRVVVLAALLSSPAAFAQDWRSADSPFILGEGHPETPATCDTIGYWIDRAPDIMDRISLTIVGDLMATHWDGTLAYLVMCQEPGVLIMCVTYSPGDYKPGDVVQFAGGYSRAGERHILLDPCLTSPAS